MSPNLKLLGNFWRNLNLKKCNFEENLLHTFFRARRAAKEAKEAPAQPAPAKVKVEVKKFVKIGRPGYKGRQALAFYMVVTLWFIILVSLKNALLKKINVFFFFFFYYSQ